MHENLLEHLLADVPGNISFTREEVGEIGEKMGLLTKATSGAVGLASVAKFFIESRESGTIDTDTRKLTENDFYFDAILNGLEIMTNTISDSLCSLEGSISEVVERHVKKE